MQGVFANLPMVPNSVMPKGVEHKMKAKSAGGNFECRIQ